MADPKDEQWSSPFTSGAASPIGEAPPAPRTPVLGWARDTGIDIARGGLGILRDITGAKAAIATTAPDALGAKDQRENLDALEDIDRWMKKGKTETGRYYDEHPDQDTWGNRPVNKATQTVAGLVPYAPLAAAGPFAAPVFGGLAYGHAQSELRERIRNAPEDELMKSPEYANYRDQGMSPNDARDQLFVDASDPTKLKNLLAVAPAVAGNILGGGIGGVMLSKATQRTLSEAITEKIMGNLANSGFGRRAAGAGGAAMGGAAGMGGNELTSQMQQQTTGMKRDDIDWGTVGERAFEGAATFGPLGAIHGTPINPHDAGLRAQGYGGPGGRAMGRRMSPAEGGRPMVADDIGTDVTWTARAQQRQEQERSRAQEVEDLNAQSEFGPAMTDLSQQGPRLPGREMVPEDLQPSEYGQPIPPPHGPYQPGRRREMVTSDIEPVDDFGPSLRPGRKPRVPRAEQRGREMIPEDLQQPTEYAYPETTRPGEPPPSVAERPAPPPFTVPEPGAPRPAGYDPERPGGGLPPEPPPPPPPSGPRRPPSREEAVTAGGTRPAFPEIGAPERPGAPRAEGEMPYADRAPLRQALASKSEATRKAWARQLREAHERGERLSLDAFPHIRNMLRANAEHVGRMMEHYPEATIREFERGIKVEEPQSKLSPTEVGALRGLMDRAGDQVHQWANDIQRIIDSGARALTWNRLPKSMRDALGADRADIVSAFRKDPRAAADVLTQGQARRFGEAEPTRVAHDEAEPSTREEPHGQVSTRPQREATREDLGITSEEERGRQAQRAEYGPEVEPVTEKPFLRGAERRRNFRPVHRGDLGLTREGRFAPGTRARMLGTLGERLTVQGTPQRLANVLSRAAERRAERERERTTQTGNIRAAADVVHETRQQPEPGVEHIEPAVQRLKERIAEADAQRHGLQRDIAEAAEVGRGRRLLNQTIDTIAHFRDVVSDEFQRIINNIPVVREMARGEAREEARRERDANRKSRTRRADYNVRERVSRKALEQDQNAFLDRLDEIITPNKRSEDVLSPTEVSKQHLLKTGREIASLMEARVEQARQALEAAQLERTPLGKKPRIGWGVPNVRSRLHPWYDRVADLNRYSQALRKMVGRNDDAITPQRLANFKAETARGLMTNLWLREHMLKEGRVAEWEQYNREQQQMTYDEMYNRRARLQKELDEREGARTGQGFDAKRESRLRSEIDQLNDMIEALNEQGGRDPVEHFDPYLSEAELADQSDMRAQWFKGLQEESRKIMLDWVRQRMSGMREEDAIQQQREIERQRAENRQIEQRRESPREPTHQEKRTRLDQLQERAEQIREALDNLPQDLDKNIRQSIDTLRYATAKPGEQPERLTRPQMTGDKLRSMIRDLHEELTSVENEARGLATDLNPRILQDDYGLGGVLDSTANLDNRRNLPAGAYALRVSDFIKGPQLSEGRGAGGGAPIRERRLGQTVVESLRPGKDVPGANLINHYLDVINEVSGDAHLVVLSPEQMILANRARGLPPETPAFYDVKTHRILIGRDHFNGPDRTRILMHEFGHPMTEAALQRFPEIGRRLDNIRKIVRQEWFNDHEGVREALGPMGSQGLDNVHEFISELYSDGGKLAQALHSIKTTEAERADLAPSRRSQSMLDRLLKTIKRGFTNLFFSVSKKRLLNDATINALDLFESIRAQGRVRPRPEDIARPITFDEGVNWARKVGRDTSERAQTFLGDWNMKRVGMKLSNLSDLERMGTTAMQGFTTKVSQVLDRRNARARDLERARGTEEIAGRLADLERVNYRAYEELQDYVADENHYLVSGADPIGQGRNKHIDPTKPTHQQYRDAHANLSARWERLTDVQKQLRNDMLEHYSTRHDQMLRAELGQLIDAKKMIPGGAPESAKSALMKSILDGDDALSAGERRALVQHVPGYDPADTALHAGFAKTISELRHIPQFKKLPIWYPSMRRGNWVVEARYNLHRHLRAGERQLQRKDGQPSGEYEFNSAAARDAFDQRVQNDPAFRGVRHMGHSDIVYAKGEGGRPLLDADGNPVILHEYGERTRTTGDELEPGYRQEVTEGVARRVRPKDAGDEGVVRYRSQYNPLLLEFHERQLEAQKRHAALKPEADAGHLTLTHVEPIRDHKNTYVDPSKFDRIFGNLQNSLVNSKGWRDMDETTRGMVLQDLKEGAIRTMMSTSARSTMLPRRFAQGEDKSLLRNFIEYNKKTAHTLAGLEHRTELADALGDVDKYVRENRYSNSPDDPQGKYGVTHAELRRTLHERAMQTPADQNFWTAGLTKLLRVSYIDKLMSPMFTTLQVIEPWVISAPALAGEHGFKAYAELGRAFRDLHGGRVFGQGLGDAARTVAAGPFARLKQSDLAGRLKDNIRGDAEALGALEHMERHSQLDRDTGLELGQIYNAEGSTLFGSERAGQTLDWLDHMNRQVNSNVEGLNRAAIGLAAYRLARKAGKSDADAKEYMRKMVHETAGNYNAYASAPIFNNPVLRPALQFKRYAQRMATHWMRAVVGSFGNLSPEQRSAYQRQLMFMVGTTVMTSGLLGLPTEPLKAVINAASPFTGFNSDDAERWTRETASDLIGPEMSEFILKGGLRTVGLGAGSRMGFDTLLTSGALGRKPEDWLRALGTFVGGAPLSYLIDFVQGAQSGVSAVGHLMNGRDSEAAHEALNFAERTVPIKFFADTLAATRRQIGGPSERTGSAQREQGYQPSMADTLMNAWGVQSARQQNISEKKAAMRADMARYDQGRKRLLDMYARADNPGERAAIQRQILQDFNADWPSQMAVTVADMLKARQRHEFKQTADPSLFGVTMSRRQTSLLPRYSAYRTD